MYKCGKFTRLQFQLLMGPLVCKVFTVIMVISVLMIMANHQTSCSQCWC